MINGPLRCFLFAAAIMLPNSFLLAQDVVSPRTTTTPTFSFSAPESLTPGEIGSVALAGDLNGDGNIDLIVQSGNPATVKVLLGNGKGGFTPSTSAPPADFHGNAYMGPDFGLNLVDLNGDGKLDILQVYPGQIDPSQCDNGPTVVTVWFGDGKGGFSAPVSYDLDPADSIASTYGDFNGDGKIDIAVFTWNDDGSNCEIEGPTLNILLNNGDGTFGTGQVIRAATSGSNPAAIALGPKSSSANYNSAAVSGYGGLVAGDFNGDGKVDLVLNFPYGNQPGSLHLLYGDGKGNFPEVYNYTVDAPIDSMAAADLNGDGKTDLVLGLYAKDVAGDQPRLVTLLAKQTEGLYWASSTDLPNPGVYGLDYPAILALMDLNGDGKLDVVLENSADHNTEVNVLVLAGEGGGVFAPARSIYVGPDTSTSPFAAAPFKAGALPDYFLSLNKDSTPYVYYLANHSK